MTIGKKYLVFRPDGTIPAWPLFVLGARDMASVSGLRSYASMALLTGAHEDYVEDLKHLAQRFEAWKYDDDHGGAVPETMSPDDLLDFICTLAGRMSEEDQAELRRRLNEQATE
jgi:hypothetical protein